MPRQARRKSESGIYHIMLRGINRQVIFEDDEDSFKFLETLKNYKAISGYKVFAFCLMSNHVHLLLKVEKEDIDLIVKRIASSYVYGETEGRETEGRQRGRQRDGSLVS